MITFHTFDVFAMFLDSWPLEGVTAEVSRMCQLVFVFSSYCVILGIPADIPCSKY